MFGTSRNNAVCFENLEEALAKDPETYGHLDLLCAGWPCQDNSIAGSRKGHKGKRSGLWKEVNRLVRIFRPKWFIGENVPGLFSVNSGQDFWEVISNLDSLGYCVAWRVLDSQFFGVAQRRKRVFIVASFGNIGASKVLFGQESSAGNDKKKQKMGERGLCLSTRDGEKQDPTAETLIASTIRVNRDGEGSPFGFGNENIVAQTIGATPRGNTSFVWQDPYIAEANANGKRKPSRLSEKLDARRGIVLGNAVSVPVAEWIGERIIKYG